MTSATSLTIYQPNELGLLLELSGDAYRLLMYLRLKSNEDGVWNNIPTKKIQEELGLGRTKTYEILALLQEKGYITHNGQKRFIKVHA